MEEGEPDAVIENMRDDMCKGDITAEFYTDVSRIPDPADHDSTQKNLLILDDIMLGPQNKAEHIIHVEDTTILMYSTFLRTTFVSLDKQSEKMLTF